MFDACQKSAGTDYTKLAALLAIALLFSPAALMFFRPVGYLSVFLAIATSGVCLTVAALTWRKSSQLAKQK
jgi:hypothetical protein